MRKEIKREISTSTENAVNPQIESQIKEIMAKLTPIEEQLRAKIDCDIFDDELDNIRTLLSH
jgi:hypothetical protein